MERRVFAVVFAAACLALLGAGSLFAGQVRGTVKDESGTPLPGVSIALRNDLTGYEKLATTGTDGAYAIFNVPDNPYHLTADLDGYLSSHTEVDVRGAVPVTRDVVLRAGVAASTTVTATREAVALETDTSSTHVDIDRSLIRRFPTASASRAFESLVLSAPGFSQDENGRYHFQGGHSQQLLVIDGQPIGDQVGITFSNSFNPAIVEGMEIEVGGVPAEFGEKANGVINMTTRSALGQAGWKGDVGVGAGSFKTFDGSAAIGYGGARRGLFAAFDGSTSDRFLDPVSFDNFHNHGSTLRGFLRQDWLSQSGTDTTRLTASAGRTRRDVTNLPSQEAAGQDQRVSSNDWNANLGWTHVSDGGSVLEAQVFGRDSRLELLSSAQDTPVQATQNRSLRNQGLSASWSSLFGDHQIKVGIQGKRFPIAENFRFTVTDPAFNDPDSEEFNPNLAPFDATRGGSPFAFRAERTGTYAAAFAEDTVKWSHLTLNLGLRYDRNRLFRSETYLQPRAGVAYFVPRTHTVLRASYDRMLVTPEYENILLSSSAAARALAPPEIQEAQALGGGGILNRSERHRAWTVGVQQGLGQGVRLDASYWNRQVTNSADQAQFFNTGIVFPVNFKGADLSGWNLRADFGPFAGLRGYLSLGHVHALYEGPASGGLFLDAEALESLDAGKFVIDHDQDLQEQAGVFWDIRDTGFWVGLTQRYDSGLVADAGALEDVLASPDTAYAAPYLRFDDDPQRVKPRTIWNASIGARLARFGLPFEVQIDALNLTDEKGLYNFQSVFGGTHVVPPRAFSGRLRFVF